MNKVPVGEDQKQHIEITRDYAIRLNNILKSTGGEDLLNLPEYI